MWNNQPSINNWNQPNVPGFAPPPPPPPHPQGPPSNNWGIPPPGYPLNMGSNWAYLAQQWAAQRTTMNDVINSDFGCSNEAPPPPPPPPTQHLPHDWSSHQLPPNPPPPPNWSPNQIPATTPQSNWSSNQIPPKDTDWHQMPPLNSIITAPPSEPPPNTNMITHKPIPPHVVLHSEGHDTSVRQPFAQQSQYPPVSGHTSFTPHKQQPPYWSSSDAVQDIDYRHMSGQPPSQDVDERSVPHHIPWEHQSVPQESFTSSLSSLGSDHHYGRLAPPPPVPAHLMHGLENSYGAPEPGSEDATAAAARRRQLPAWLRDELDKLERKKAREAAVSTPAVTDASEAPRDAEGDVVMEDAVSPQFVEKEDAEQPDTGRFDSPERDGESSDVESLTNAENQVKKKPIVRVPLSELLESFDEDDRHIELTRSITRVLTEVLLEVTNDMIDNVAIEEWDKADLRDINKQHLGRRKGVPSSKPISTPTTTLSNLTAGLVGYGSGESSGSEDEGGKSSREPSPDRAVVVKDLSESESEAELERLIRQKKASFAAARARSASIESSEREKSVEPPAPKPPVAGNTVHTSSSPTQPHHTPPPTSSTLHKKTASTPDSDNDSTDKNRRHRHVSSSSRRHKHDSSKKERRRSRSRDRKDRRSKTRSRSPRRRHRSRSRDRKKRSKDRSSSRDRHRPKKSHRDEKKSKKKHKKDKHNGDSSTTTSRSDKRHSTARDHRS